MSSIAPCLTAVRSSALAASGESWRISVRNVGALQIKLALGSNFVKLHSSLYLVAICQNVH